MIINSLKLKNIRSYIDEEIKLREGSTLLSGDIGTGKTSLLLAIEFALFGIIRGQISGTSLLRHGAKEGSVELSFSLEKNNVTIKRVLRRGAKAISQEAGYIIINNLKIEGTPIELKAKILELIGYPDELLTKSKSYIYRYTVYTPQEEMKHILFEGKDERLDVLRKIFGMDKYKRIKENTIQYIRELKTLKTALETRIEDLDPKQTELKEYDERVNLLNKDIHEVAVELKKITHKLSDKKEKLTTYEQEMKEFAEIKRNISLRKLELNNKKQGLESNQRELRESEDKITNLKKQLKDFDTTAFDAIQKKIRENEDRQEILETNIAKINERETEFKTKKSTSEDIKKEILELDKCPVCRQQVTEDHKHSVKLKEDNNISRLNHGIQELLVLKEKRDKEITELKARIEVLNRTEREMEISKVKFDNLKEFITRSETLKSNLKTTGEEILFLQKEIKRFEEQTHKYSLTEKHYDKEKEHVEEIRALYNEAIAKQASFSATKNEINDKKQRLETEINIKLVSKKKLIKVNETQNWLMKFFLNVTSLMEKQIMMKINQEFNEHFMDWFNILIEDENLNVRLDEEFAPIIEQNGYETYLDNLSGGEKTSVALAYRLALNRVINDFISTIKTKNLIILDEPTDGFSTEQLDKLRDVLEELRIKQVIIVSHEPKLESYVDNILRITKNEHMSRVIA